MIEFVHLRKEFDNVLAVEDLSLAIPPGEIFGLIGPNGAGKTTTIRMACGLLAPTLGRALIAGVDVAEEPERAQQNIGYLSDFFAVYEDLKVWEYLDFFAHAYKMPGAEIPARITEVIAQVNLEVKRDAMIGGLSRGMKQRLGIARAIIHRPKVMLLDEPASGLDPKARLELRNLLRGLRDQGATILISSHILTELEGFCTSIGIMEKGRMVRSGSIEEVTAAAASQRRVRLSWAGNSQAVVEEKLQRDPRVSEVSLAAGAGTFRFSGSEEDLAPVLAGLVAANVPVTSFGEVKQTVEQLYMKLSTHEVM
ncbi:ABC-type multidrug transport system, ATPase component [Candidatus Sulfotelmatobacter kueseliae]|uniref:ABC-type multidrug transport system, ATPase component n=1 Tax=Candidatus Sulfotelmatobacter kueseliae TaxID=2042962 RepID=A0A2U3K697_9BACT|nr:ABC-type multidrug transport system, ATPase component [Candidatus Sulfotelmatobacter kueseliae]